MTGFAREQCERDVLSESSNLVRNARQNTTDSLRGLYDLLLALSVIEGPKTLILMSEGLILDTPSDLDAIIRAAAMARVTINVLLMDVPRDDITVGQLGPTVTEDRDMAVSGLADLAGGSRGSLYYVVGTGELIFDRLAGETLAYYMLGVEESSGRPRRQAAPHRRRGRPAQRDGAIAPGIRPLGGDDDAEERRGDAARRAEVAVRRGRSAGARHDVHAEGSGQRQGAHRRRGGNRAAGRRAGGVHRRLRAARHRRQGRRRRHRQADAVGARRAAECAARLPWRDHRRAGDLLAALRRRRHVGAARRRDSRGQRVEARRRRVRARRSAGRRRRH